MRPRFLVLSIASLFTGCGATDTQPPSFHGVVIDSLQGRPRPVFTVYFGPDTIAVDSIMPDSSGRFTITNPVEPLTIRVGSQYPYFPFIRTYPAVPNRVDTLRLERSDPYVRAVSLDNLGVIRGTIISLLGAGKINRHDTWVAFNNGSVAVFGDNAVWTWQQADAYTWSVAIQASPTLTSVYWLVYDSTGKTGSFLCTFGTARCTGE